MMTMIASFHSPEPYLAARIQDHQKGGVSLLESVPRGQKNVPTVVGSCA